MIQAIFVPLSSHSHIKYESTQFFIYLFSLCMSSYHHTQQKQKKQKCKLRAKLFFYVFYRRVESFNVSQYHSCLYIYTAALLYLPEYLRYKDKKHLPFPSILMGRWNRPISQKYISRLMSTLSSLSVLDIFQFVGLWFNVKSWLKSATLRYKTESDLLRTHSIQSVKQNCNSEVWGGHVFFFMHNISF